MFLKEQLTLELQKEAFCCHSTAMVNIFHTNSYFAIQIISHAFQNEMILHLRLLAKIAKYK